MENSSAYLLTKPSTDKRIQFDKHFEERWNVSNCAGTINGGQSYELPIELINVAIFFHSSTALVGLGLLIVLVSRAHSFRHTTECRTPLDEGSAHRRDLYVSAHTTLIRDRPPCPRRDLKLQSQQASSRRPTPSTAGILIVAIDVHNLSTTDFFFKCIKS
jgi:hypothetical protein